MTPHRTSRLRLRAWPLALCALVLSGCASWEAPRIDPSGERVLIWPGETPPAPTLGPPVIAPAGPGAPVIAPPTVPVAPPIGNIEAPPVYSNAPVSVGNPPAIATAVGPPAVVPVGPAQPIGAATPIAMAPGAVPLSTTDAALVGQDHLRLTPQRVLAPVGSEVVLKAGICTADGFLLANQRVEWLLDRSGVGQFVDLNNRDELDLFRWPSNTPRKLDNWYAIGATSTSTMCLRRGNADPNDDVQICRGEAWITVTSSAEGTSHITAYTPRIDNWQHRRAMATIYWMDAQWVFPPSATVAPGRPHVLTTTVMRRSDGAPLAGWLVRYQVAGGTASLGYGGGSSIDVPTDATGRASVEVSPTGAGGGATTIQMTIIRPPQAGPGAGPQLELGTGVATIAWGSDAVPCPSTPAPVTPVPGPATSPPTLPGPAPSQDAPSGTYTPPPSQPSTGTARLTVSIRREGPEEVAVGGRVRFNVVVTNEGDGTARRIEVLDKFDSGLSHAQALPNELAVKYPGMRDLPPGESASVPLDFEVVAPGRQCHEVTVTAEGGIQAVERACVTAREPEPAVQPSLSATMTGPTRRLVGEVAEFRAVITNTGDVPVTNIKIVDRYDAALTPTQAEAGHVPLSGDGLEWNVDRLDVGERREFRVHCNCTMPSRSACNRVIVTADGGVTTADEACVEILPQLEPEAPDAAAPGATSNLQLSVSATPNPTRVRQRTLVNVTVENTGQEPQRQVMLRLLLPPEMTPVADQIQGPAAASVQGQEVRFAAMAEVAPGEQRFIIPVDVNSEGSVRIWARLDAEGVTNGVTVQSDVISIGPASF